MGYESRIYLVHQDKFTYTDIETGDVTQDIYNFVVATVDLSKLGSDFDVIIKPFFKEKLEGEIYVNGDESTHKDCYGDHIKCSDDFEGISRAIDECSNYRRTNILKGLLQGINRQEWTYKSDKPYKSPKGDKDVVAEKRIFVAHYGH